MSVIFRERKLKNGLTSVRLDIHFNGRRYHEPLDIKYKTRPNNNAERQHRSAMERLVKRIVLEKESELLEGVYKESIKDDEKHDFFEYASTYLTQIQTSKEIRIYRAAVNKFKMFINEGSLLFSDINDNLVERFISYLRKHLNGETPHNYYKCFRRILKSARKKKISNYEIGDNIICPKGNGSVKETLTSEEIRKLFFTECTNPDIKAAFIFSCYTGLRFCDIMQLKWKDVRSDKVRMFQQKTGELVEVPFVKSTADILGKRKDANQWVFNLPSHTACSKHLRIWTKKAGIEKHITWHCARHSFGTNLTESGVDILTTSKLMGHTSTRHTIRYTRISEKQKSEAIQRLVSI